MIAGERSPGKLAALASQRIKASPKALYDALHGRLTGHHRFMLRFNLDQCDALASSSKEIDQHIDAVIAKMDEALPPARTAFGALVELLCTVPGVEVVARPQESHLRGGGVDPHCYLSYAERRRCSQFQSGVIRYPQSPQIVIAGSASNQFCGAVHNTG